MMLCVFLILQVFCISVSCTLYRIHGKETEKHQIQSREEDNLIASQTATISFDRTSESDTDTWEVVIQENNLPGSMVIEVSAHASDPELDKAIVYRLSEPTLEAYGDIFELQEDRKSLHPTGILIAKQSLDFEDAAEYRLLVVASLGDPGTEPTDHLVITVMVTDMNDNPPKITVNSPSGEAKVERYVPAGTFVADITVTDADSGLNGEFDCQIKDDEFGGDFLLKQLNETDFKLFTEGIFHEESPPVVTVTIKCTDKGVPMFTASKRIPVYLV